MAPRAAQGSGAGQSLVKKMCFSDFPGVVDSQKKSGYHRTTTEAYPNELINLLFRSGINEIS
jgi:hypothetical protein